MRSLFVCVFVVLSFLAKAKELKGKVIDETKEGIPGAFVSIKGNRQKSTYTDNIGYFLISDLKEDSIEVVVSSVGSKSRTFPVILNKNQDTTFVLLSLFSNVVIIDSAATIIVEKKRTEVGATTVDGKPIETTNQGTDDISNIIKVIGNGVRGNNELSSEYTVRGGNFDENLVYVNGIPVYKPFLTKSGQQDGLSFPNPNLVKGLTFYGGGWSSKYGDKLSSVLDVDYKRPEEFKASVTAGMLGGAAHVEGKYKRLSVLAGARLKSSQYLLNTLPTSGEYRPRFFDVQSLIEYELDTNRHTTIGILTTFARNSYYFEPSTQQVSFGTSDKVLQLRIAYDGSELLEYDLYQSAIKFYREQSKNLRHTLIFSTMYTQEREFRDLEGGYRFCDIFNSPDISATNECLDARGVGTRYEYARNSLEGSIFNVKYDGELLHLDDSSNTSLHWGVQVSRELIEDDLYEYTYQDSSNYIDITSIYEAKNTLKSFRPTAYVEGVTHFNDTITRKLTYGVRLGYWSYNQQFLVSPRVQYAWEPTKTKKDLIYKVALGVYQQPPFYREMRNLVGEINENVKAQSSVHSIVGRDLNFMRWNRRFKFTSEAYFKYLWNVIPYDLDNMSIRYFAENNATAYVMGTDFRISGEFIDGEESWFSLGFMRAREDVEGDGKGYIKRPSSQLMSFSAFFQDHLPNRPSLKMNISIVYNTGLPFGPPNDLANRNSFTATAYRRVDVGFSKMILKKEGKKSFESLWIGLNVLNVLGVKNVVSYNWVADTDGFEYAVPNHLSGRFYNLKMILKI